LIAVLVLAGPPAPAPATAAKLAFKATLQAPTHRPLAGQQWRYVVRVTDNAGKGIRASARFRIVFNVPSAPPPLGLGRATFRGRYSDTFRWRRSMRGVPLVFQAIVTARGETQTLRYSVRVR
jgi:hypothetical protein